MEDISGVRQRSATALTAVSGVTDSAPAAFQPARLYMPPLSQPRAPETAVGSVALLFREKRYIDIILANMV